MDDSSLKKSELEELMEKIYYDTTYEDWIKNFSFNLSNIWKESSANELSLDEQSNSNSAIVIGRGPSLKKHNHLKKLAASNYNGSIICCDGALITALKAGITPDKFPKFYVVTIDPFKQIQNFYNDAIVDEFGGKIQGIFSTIVDPTTTERARKAGIKIHWLHSLFDYHEGKKSFNNISAIMVRAGRNNKGLPAIQTGGNVGTSSWFIGWKILKCNIVTLIGIDHGWSEEDPKEKIITHNFTHKPIVLEQNSPMEEKLFPKIFNSEFQCYCILDPIFQYYSNALREFIARSPRHIKTINATEGGSIFGENIHCITFDDFLSEHNN
jgi:hypothetical protein